MKALKTSLLLFLSLCASVHAAPPTQDIEFKDGKLLYNADDRGNRVPDYSYAGYAAGERPIPTVPAKLVVGAPANDNTAALQAAIDQAGRLDMDPTGFRGAVLIPPGTYPLAGSLVLNTSGVVLRGSGMGPDGTTLLATGPERDTVIQIRGTPIAPLGDERPVANAYVPVNAMTLSIADSADIAPGDAVRITHPSTKEWVAALGMNDFGGDRHGPSWRPGSRDLHWTRIVTSVEANALTLDAPLTFALDSAYGTSSVTKLDAEGLVRNVGVENLRIVSTFAEHNPSDEEHAWFGIGIQHARDVWVRRVVFQHLVGSAVAAWEGSSRVTVEDCKNLQPVGEIGGWRRNAFFANGQQVLMQRLYSEEGVHDFAVGLAAAGPNAFVECESVRSHGESGAIDSAACGTLFDRVRIDGRPLSLRDRGYQGQGSGWASFNGMIWNSSAGLIANEKPPVGQNWAYGTHGEFNGDGAWVGSDDDVSPDSLYYAQLSNRIGRDVDRAKLLLPPVQGSRAPTLESAAEAIEVSMKPRVDVSQWIDQLVAKDPIPVSTDGLEVAKSPARSRRSNAAPAVRIENGWITRDGAVVVGESMRIPWWNGGARPDDVARAQPALTRFVPGREGKGLTDVPAELVDQMRASGQVALFQHPPLWFDRRRDDHQRVRRVDGDVVAPFYETPWARTGEGQAYDGLSRWDVTKANPWYFARLREFADRGAEKGLLLFNGLYMQHSVLEAGAHYADFPWRPANNVNNVGIPEPVFYAGDKLIYVAEQFYDVANPGRAVLHRTYMRNVLSELADRPNLILFLSEEYTGPLAFVQFWLDVVAEWKQETGQSPQVALYATKDVTDAILADEKRAAVVSILYNRFNNANDAGWWYQPDGTLYAPEGGKNLAPRQWGRLLKPKNAGFEQVYRAVREYRTKYPDKPFVYDGPTEFAWAALLGGGSLAPLPTTTEPELLKGVTRMRPMADQMGLQDDAGNRLVYADQKPAGNQSRGIDMKTGQITTSDTRLFWIKAQ